MDGRDGSADAASPADASVPTDVAEALRRAGVVGVRGAAEERQHARTIGPVEGIETAERADVGEALEHLKQDVRPALAPAAPLDGATWRPTESRCDVKLGAVAPVVPPRRSRRSRGWFGALLSPFLSRRR
jgi:hypothetical protein